MSDTFQTPYLLDGGTHRLLVPMMLINGYFTYDGKLVSLEEIGGGQINAILYAAVVTIVIYAVWGWAYRILPKLHSMRKRILASVFVAAFACFAIPHMSALPNLVSFIAGSAAGLHLKNAVSDSSQILARTVVNTSALQKIAPILQDEKELYFEREHLELTEGEYTGVPDANGGAVSNSLGAIGGRLQKLTAAVRQEAVRISALIIEAQDILGRMRQVVRTDTVASEKMIVVSKLTDRFRTIVTEINNRGTILLVQHTLKKLPNELATRRILSGQKAIAEKQSAAFSRLEKELSETLANLTPRVEALLARPNISVPTLEILNAEDVTLAYWAHFKGQAVAAVAIDYAPGILLVLVMITVWGRTEEEEANEEMANLSVRSIVKAGHSAVVVAEALKDVQTLETVFAGSIGKIDVDTKMLGSSMLNQTPSSAIPANPKRTSTTKIVKPDGDDNAQV